MALYFQNKFSDTIWIAFLYNDSGCGGTPFRKLGWWAVASGQTLNVWNTDLRNVGRYAAFYAEEFKDSGGATWSGNGNNWYRISDAVFNLCYDDNTNCNQQPDFMQLDFAGYCNMTVVLGPAAGQLSIQSTQCGPILTAWPKSQPANFYTSFNFSGTGFPTGIDYYMWLVGFEGLPPISTGIFVSPDANGNFSGAYGFICQNPNPAPNIVLEARVGNTTVIASANPISFGCSW